MTVRYLLETGVELRGDVVFCFLDERKGELVGISGRDAFDSEIRRLYANEDVLVVEVQRKSVF